MPTRMAKKMRRLPVSISIVPLLIAAVSRGNQEDLLIADFEGPDYGDWTRTGAAFGAGPAKGTLPGQMHVSGYRGDGLVNSFHKGDGTTGTLTSPPFTVERRYLVFLISGGGFEGTTCMNLLLDDEVVRTATGPNTEPGGSEELAPWVWDLTDLAGETVTIQIVDERTGGWGHINVDHIVQSDRKPDIPKRPGLQTRQIQLTKRYLLFPIRTGANKTQVDLRIDGRDVRQFDADLARTKQETDFWSFLDIGAFRGQTATVVLSNATEETAALVALSDELPIAIYNKRRGDWAFSGSAVVDEHNTAGWQTGDEKVIVAAWTSTGRGECVAYSNDRGRTFTEYEDNPVVKHDGRDPKIIWYAPGEHWVMAVYSKRDDQPTIAFHSSKNLKDWKLESHLEGYYECPEIFVLPVDGNAADTRWVVFAADAQYAIGNFDGKAFTPLHGGKNRVHYGQYYAAQTFSNAPDGRRIQIGWARIDMPGMPFNQTFSFPHEMTLRTTGDGVRLFAEPVREIETLYKRRHVVEGAPLAADKLVDLPVAGELFDIRARFELGDATSVGLEIGSDRIIYDASEQKLQDADLAPIGDEVEIRVLVDRPMLEIVGNRGRVYITSARETPGAVAAIRAFAEGGTAKLAWLEAHELKSIWRN